MGMCCGKSWMVAGLVVAGLGLGAMAYQPAQTEEKKQPAQQPGEKGREGQPRDGQRDGQRGPGARGESPNVEASMKLMNRAFKTLKDQAGDADKRAENLRLVNDIQRGIVMAKGGQLSGKIVKDLDDKAKAKKQEDFRVAMHSLLAQAMKLEEQVADGKGSEASATIDAIMKERDEMHEKFGVKD